MSQFELFAFYSNEDHLHTLDQTEISGYVVDLEKKGKRLRQQLYDTQVTEHTQEDLIKVRQYTNKWLICRINNSGLLDTDELSRVIDAGTDEIIVPMVKSEKEIESILSITNNRAKVSVMLETLEAIEILESLNELPIERIYVGLNDLAIQSKSKNIFSPLVDGTIERIASKVDKKLGVAGLTHPNLGHPIPCQWLIDIMKTHACSFGILRRSFYRDMNQYTAKDIVSSLIKEFDSDELHSVTEDQIRIIKNAYF